MQTDYSNSMKHTVNIEKIIAGGMGLARPDNGKVVMVSRVLPGETVRVSVVKEHRGYIEAEPVELLTPSPARRIPECPWYGDCGGCDLQHCNDQAQLEIKKNIISEALERVDVTCSSECLSAPLPSPEPLAYRYRLRMKIDADGRVGFHSKGTNTIIPVMRCAVATDRINTAITFLQSVLLLKKTTGNCREIELLHSPADDTLTLLLPIKEKTQVVDSLLADLLDSPAIDQAAYKIDFHLHPGSLLPLRQEFTLATAQQNSCMLSWSAGCFSQVNARQNEQLVQLLCTLAGNLQNTTLLDLYCGMGNFSIPLALQGAAVTGIELNRESIKWAQCNAETAGVTCRFFAADVHNSLQELVRNKEQVDTIVLDPPRRGIVKTAGLLTRLYPQKILYISCDPATLARDLAIICKRGYSLKQLIPVDMFPQTHHIESVALLKKN